MSSTVRFSRLDSGQVKAVWAVLGSVWWVFKHKDPEKLGTSCVIFHNS